MIVETRLARIDTLHAASACTKFGELIAIVKWERVQRMARRKWKPALAESLGPLLLRSMELPARRSGAAAPEPADLVIASYNVHKCVGLDGRFDPDRTISVIRELEADIVALQEVDQRFGQRMGLLDLDRIQDACGLVPIPLRPTRKGHGWHGNLVLCRPGAVSAARQLALPGGEPRGALIVDMALPSGPLRIVAAHLGLLRRSRERQVEAILDAIAADDDMPTLMMGDLNEWRLGARSSLRALDTVFGAQAPLLVASFPAGYPVLALDRILGDREGLVVGAAVHDSDLAHVASDHLPVKAWIRLDGAAGLGKDTQDTAAA